MDADEYNVLHIGTYRNMLHGQPPVNADFTDAFDKTARTLTVSCPTCKAAPDQWCTQPSGQYSKTVHIARFRASL